MHQSSALGKGYVLSSHSTAGAGFPSCFVKIKIHFHPYTWVFSSLISPSCSVMPCWLHFKTHLDGYNINSDFGNAKQNFWKSAWNLRQELYYNKANCNLLYMGPVPRKLNTDFWPDVLRAMPSPATVKFPFFGSQLAVGMLSYLSVTPIACKEIITQHMAAWKTHERQSQGRTYTCSDIHVD